MAKNTKEVPQYGLPIKKEKKFLFKKNKVGKENQVAVAAIPAVDAAAIGSKIFSGTFL